MGPRVAPSISKSGELSYSCFIEDGARYSSPFFVNVTKKHNTDNFEVLYRGHDANT
jgi:hypothetical protein